VLEKTGKSTYLKAAFPESVYYDLLLSERQMRWSKEPHLLREEVLALPPEALCHPIIIDEVQKVPALLDEVHWLIENTDAYFILCGSSARKLRQAGVNLLGGRAWRYLFYPLVYAEYPEVDLLTTLNCGLIPSHYFSTQPVKSLEAYVNEYLIEEIQAESVVRDLPSFARFLDAAAWSNGELLNYANIAQDCHVNAKTVKAYYQILYDTLLGYYLPPFAKRHKRDVISSTNKFYLFDVGVANHLSRHSIKNLRGEFAGCAFEHYILMELMAFRGWQDRPFQLCYWRTKTGLEVDFVLGQAEVAVEVKISRQVRKSDLRGLLAFVEEYPSTQAYVVSQDPAPRRIQLDNKQSILILPWREFLTRLWAGEIFK